MSEPLSEADIATLRSAARASGTRVGFVELGGRAMVVKRQRRRSPRRGWRERSIEAVVRVIGDGLWLPLRTHGGTRGQEIEVERLRGLRGAGLRVPAVLHVEAGFFAMEKLPGPRLADVIGRGGPKAFDAWRRGLALLTDAHARGVALSDAGANNFIVTDAGLGLVGCAADPLEALPLEAAQARDWLTYLHSTLPHRPGTPAATQAAIAVLLADEPPPVRAAVERAAGRFAALRHLPLRGRPFGRGVAGASAIGAVFPLPPIAFQTIDGIL